MVVWQSRFLLSGTRPIPFFSTAAAIKSVQLRMVLRLIIFVAATICWRGALAEEVRPLPKIRVEPQSRSFVMETGRTFVPSGVTYYRPGTGWAPQVWKQFDPEATRRDFALMKENGVNCVRVFLSFGSFYTEPGKLMQDGIAKFDQFLDIAEAAGIYVHPTGPDHWEGTPDWAKVDRIADEQVLRALEQFWTLFARRYRDRNVIFAYDLRNEPEVAWDTPVLREKWKSWLARKYPSVDDIKKAWHAEGELTFKAVDIPPAREAPGDKKLLDYQLFREEIATEWTSRQVRAIKAADPKALVTVGLIQWSVPSLLPAIQHYSGFRPARIAPLVDFMEIHFYPFANGFYEYKPEDERRNLAYLESVVRETAFPDKPLVIAEFGWYGGGKLTLDGGKHPEATEEQQARWCSQLIQTTRTYAAGWLNWGLFDQPEAGDVSQLTGLFTPAGKPKAWASKFKDAASALANHRAPLNNLPTRPALDWDACLTSLKTQAEFREAYLRQFPKESEATMDSRASQIQWVRSDLTTNSPVWGIKDGLQFALHPVGFTSGKGGPRGLIRIGYPTLTNGVYDLINFIAVEPIVAQTRGYSELEKSTCDGKPGKLFWVGSGEMPKADAVRVDPGELLEKNGHEELAVRVHVERFQNGAHVRLKLTQGSDAPDELRITVEAEPDSAPIQLCILTATMANKARARLLFLKDGPVSSSQLYPNYREDGFAPHRVFGLETLPRTPDDDVLVSIMNDEEDPSGVEPFGKPGFWDYRGTKVVQYWRKSATEVNPGLVCAVNGRFSYWMSKQPIPGGIAFENFELREPFKSGQTSIFGISRSMPELPL